MDNTGTGADRCLFVFTSRPVSQMAKHGGSQAWVLNPRRARECRYIVCAWNPRGEHAQPNAGLRAGQPYLVAPIAAIEPADPAEPSGRSIVRFREFAVPPRGARDWNGQRNPVAYTSLAALDIDVDSLTFEPLASLARGATTDPFPQQNDVASLTFAAAKLALSRHYGVPVDAIEITIRA